MAAGCFLVRADLRFHLLLLDLDLLLLLLLLLLPPHVKISQNTHPSPACYVALLRPT